MDFLSRSGKEHICLLYTSYASIMGAKAVELLVAGKTNRVVAYKRGEFLDFDIQEALNMKKDIPEDQFAISKLLVR